MMFYRVLLNAANLIVKPRNRPNELVLTCFDTFYQSVIVESTR